MKTHIASSASWLLVRIHIATASLDPEVLQWPGGILIALVISLYVVARSVRPAGAGGLSPVRG